MIDRIIFGDNQFFGINHMSAEKAQGLAEKFKDLRAITDVIDIAYDVGIRGFMLNSNDRAGEICHYLKANSLRYPELRLYPSIPYPHKYVHLVGECGMLGAIRKVILSESTVADVASMVFKGGTSLLEKDLIKVMELLIDVEMKMFRGLNVQVVFLQNVVTDLLLGFGAKEFFIGYTEYIRKHFNAEPGFITMNLPNLTDTLLSWGLKNPIVCSSINKAGYFMNPDQSSYEDAICRNNFRPMAMSIFASGAIPAQEAVDYVCKQENIQSIVFGASTKNHIVETKRLIEEKWEQHRQAKVC